MGLSVFFLLFSSTCDLLLKLNHMHLWVSFVLHTEPRLEHVDVVYMGQITVTFFTSYISVKGDLRNKKLHCLKKEIINDLSIYLAFSFCFIHCVLVKDA